MPETYELTTKTRQDLDFILEKKQAEIMALAASNVKEDSAFLLRAKLELITGPCAPLLGTNQGMQSAMKAITDTAMIGLTFGGPRPMAYFVPKEGKVTPIYEASGYKFACVYGPGAVLAEHPMTIVVKEGDSVKVNPATKTIEYKDGGYNPFDPNRGKVVGYLMRLVYKDGRVDIRDCDMAKVKKIQAGYANLGSPMYKKSDDEADLKTAEKSMLRLAFKESCQRAQVFLEGADVEYDEPETTPPQTQDERLSRNISAAAVRLDPEQSTEPVDDVRMRVPHDKLAEYDELVRAGKTYDGPWNDDPGYFDDDQPSGDQAEDGDLFK